MAMMIEARGLTRTFKVRSAKAGGPGGPGDKAEEPGKPE